MEEESKIDPSCSEYSKFFQEHVPLKLEKGEQLAHIYTVSVTKAIADKESF